MLDVMGDEVRVDSAGALDKSDPPEENGGVAAAGRQRVTHMGFARTLATVVFVLALPIALVTTNIRLLANAPLVYDYAFDRYDAEETAGLSRADLDATAKALRTYFNNDEPTFYHTVTEDGLTRPVFNARETEHMEDVKGLFVWVNRLQEASVVFILAYVVGFFVWSREGSIRQLAGQCLVGLVIGVVAVGSVGVVAAFGFDAAFERFHEIFFRNDLWRLDPSTDHLIQMFPEPFWRDMTVLLGAMCALETLVIAAVSGVYLLGTKDEGRRIDHSLDLGASRTQAA
jgi:integral membrane protein (TIGR01906 family)